MNTCDQCTHWTRRANKFDLERDGGAHRGECANTNFVDANDEHSIKPNQLIYWDYEGYSCGFATGAKFGCIHFEKKDAT